MLPVIWDYNYYSINSLIMTVFGWLKHQWQNKPPIDGLVHDCSISIANALEILQSYTKPLIRVKLQSHYTNS